MEEITVRLSEISENDSNILVSNTTGISTSLDMNLLADSMDLNLEFDEQNNQITEDSSAHSQSSPLGMAESESTVNSDGKTNNTMIELVAYEEDEETPPEEPSIDYPFIELQGVTTMQELEFLVRNQKRTKMSINLQVRFGEIMKPLGFINFDLETMQALKFIGNYSITLHKDNTNQSQINLADPNTFVKLIRL